MLLAPRALVGRGRVSAMVTAPPRSPRAQDDEPRPTDAADDEAFEDDEVFKEAPEAEALEDNDLEPDDGAAWDPYAAPLLDPYATTMQEHAGHGR